MKTLNLSVAGMGCDHCTTRVTQVLNELDGVEVKAVSASMGIASVVYDPQKAQPEAIATTLGRAGFPTQLPVAK